MILKSGKNRNPNKIGARQFGLFSFNQLATSCWLDYLKCPLQNKQRASNSNFWRVVEYIEITVTELLSYIPLCMYVLFIRLQILQEAFHVPSFSLTI